MRLLSVAAAAVDRWIVLELVSLSRPSVMAGWLAVVVLTALFPSFAFHVSGALRSSALSVPMFHPTKKNLKKCQKLPQIHFPLLPLLTRLDLYKLLMSNC